ncbi:MAG: M48 family metallopeptidase [Deltaproteobacteria bacterium]|nr:M48 family metallopeptidase [Deltaproteobacteria bacterium]
MIQCKLIGFRVLAVIFMVLIVSACAEVPITHREGLHLVPDAELVSMSFQQYQAVLEKSQLSTDARQTAMVRRVGMRIASAAETFLKESGAPGAIANYHWEFNLVHDDKTVNAWVMPGGKAVVYTGILKYTRDETGLAVVLGHEVGHALADHGNERLSQSLLTQLGGMALAVALQSQPQQTQALFMQAFGVGSSVGFLLPYSRLHESEADRIGLTLMARAGYDPREAIPFWQRMQAQEQSRPPEFLSTHPAPETRIRDIQAHLAEALPYYQKAIR